MKLQCTKHDLRKMIIACNESTSCYSCALHSYCTEMDGDKGEFIADIAEIVSEEDTNADSRNP